MSNKRKSDESCELYKYEFIIKAIPEIFYILAELLMQILFLSLQILFIGLLVHQIVKFALVVQLHLEQPTFLVGGPIDHGRIVLDSLVLLYDDPGDRGVQL